MVRGLLHAGGIDGIAAPALHFTAVWGGAQIMLPALDVAPAPWNSPKEEVAIDAFYHAVYAIATALAFAALQHNAS
ncbi:MAG: hypothetical protein LC790_12510 [Actinobacteria bacterium]|nr:hypothetical protein [Actinomycetota bacterium]